MLIFGFNGGIELAILCHLVEFEKLCLLGIVAAVEVPYATDGAKVTSKLKEVVVFSSSLVLLKVEGIAIPDVRITRDPEFLAQGCAIFGAINICNQYGLGVLVFGN